VISVSEQWADIIEFPRYCVSNKGNVFSQKNDNLVKPVLSPRGSLTVGLMRDGVQYKRSLPLLVARAFVPQPSEAFDTPINLNGDRQDNVAENLMWRPLSFARKYARQFANGHPAVDTPIEDVETRIVYENSMHAAMTHGLLDAEIFFSMHENTYVWPTYQVFRRAV
jgi:NUMOD4 motif-containing protein